MVKKRLLPFLLTTLLASSCGEKAELREDIKEFIRSSTFNLTEAMKEYKEGGYDSVTDKLLAGVNIKITENLSFSVKDESNISYSHTLVKKENDVVVNSRTETISMDSGKYIHNLDGEIEEYTVSQCVELIKTFFYQDEPVEGYHDRGMYYGDYITQVAVRLQNFITIHKEEEELELHYFVDDSDKHAKVDQKIMIDKYGILQSNVSETRNTESGEYVLQSITTYKN